jgi:hypothetical protein
MADKNPHNLCTWDAKSDCDNCPNTDRLNCKWNRKLLMGFLLLFLPFGFTSWFGLALVGKLIGNWLVVIAYLIFYIAFFFFFEIRILCSHCPYYGENSRILHCLANNGAIKLWSYHPEKISLVICFFFLAGYPVLAQVYGSWLIYAQYPHFDSIALLGMVGITVATLLSAVTFFACLRIYVCTKCVNFSCPLNEVPKSAVDEYLRNNSVMKAAWEQSGYILDDD